MHIDEMQKYAAENNLELVPKEHWEATQKVAALGLVLYDLPEGCALLKHKGKFLTVQVTFNNDGIEPVGKALDEVLKDVASSIERKLAPDNAEVSCGETG